MKAYILYTANGPLVMLTSFDSIQDPEFLRKLDSKGISKFVAHEVSVEAVRAKYGMHFDVVMQDLHQTDDMRIMDYSGDRVFRTFSFKEIGPAFYFESGEREFVSGFVPTTN
jgi:hypothetical protein